MLKQRIELYDDGIGAVEYVQHMGGDLTIVNAARVSFGKHKTEIDKRDKKLIKYLAKHKHTSTFEHNVVTFRFTVPLYVRSQHHRHRTWSYNEISRRYTDINMQFYQPVILREQSEDNRQASEGAIGNPWVRWPEDKKFIPTDTALIKHHRQCLELYESLIEVGVCREQARGVLPQSMYTQYYGTVNLNNLLKFIALRIHEGAQWEIQQVARACLTIAEEIWPTAVGSYTGKTLKEKI